MDSTTKSASQGEVPRSICIGKEIRSGHIVKYRHIENREN